MYIADMRMLVTNYLIDTTNKYLKDHPKIESKTEKELSPKIKDIKDKIERGNFGYRTHAVADLIGDVIGEKIPVKIDNDSINDLNREAIIETAVDYVVFTDDDNTYVLLSYSFDNDLLSGIDYKGYLIEDRFGENLRVATENEIKELVKTMTKENMEVRFSQIIWMNF